MASAALARVRQELDRTRGARRAALARAKLKAMEFEGTALTVGAAGLAGAAESRGYALPTLGDMDPKLVWGAGLSLAGLALKGKSGVRLMNAGSGLLAVVAYQFARSGSTVSGDESVEWG